MERVVDLLHGRADLPARPGHAAGSYRADVSRWTVAIILGREWEPGPVEAFDAAHPALATYAGRFVRAEGATATERFMAGAMEHFLAYEHDRYAAQRPMAFTNWPTLDPLHHPTESTRAEEATPPQGAAPPGEEIRGVRQRRGLASTWSASPTARSCQAGLFASYHAYPYYPDFLNLEPGYAAGRDARGAEPLRRLPRRRSSGHHQRHAVVVSEVGVPSSRLVAHWQPQGLTHGGQDERAQGEQDARLLRDVHQAGCAGAVLFAWIDEWFKKNWLVIEFEEPLERKPLWYNALDAEENYGLIGYRPGRERPEHPGGRQARTTGGRWRPTWRGTASR